MAEDMVRAVDHVNEAVRAEALDRRSSLELEQIDSRLAAREYEYHLHSPRRQLFEFPTEISWHVYTEQTCAIMNFGSQVQERPPHDDSQDAPNVELTAKNPAPDGRRKDPIAVEFHISSDIHLKLQILRR
jgi:hypothetical protein